MDSVLDFLDAGTKKAAFEAHLARLEATPRLDFDALRVCIRLLPPLTPEEVAGRFESSTASVTPSQDISPYEKLWGLILFHILEEQDLERLYSIVEICLGHSSIAAAQLDRRTHDALGLLLSEISNNRKKVASDEAELLLQEERIRKAVGYLNFLKCSFWLPKHQQHLISPSSIGLLSAFIGIDGLDHAAQGALSALFALLKNGGPIVVAYQKHPLQPWLKYEPALGRLVLNKTIIDQSFWNKVKMLGPEVFTSNSSHIFRTWFQWISQAVTDGVDLECLLDDLYWKRLQIGLLKGFADQRKYCLGIIRQSLLATNKDILTSTLEFHVDDRDAYLMAYEQFSVLFETIVLDRYQNQVQACLPELTLLLGPQSKISSMMATTLLAASLDSTVQEGIRKIIGNWYMNYVVEDQTDCSDHINFLLEGFLPWGTEGNLFTSTITSARAMTMCTHGSALVNVVARFISKSPDSPPSTVPTKTDILETTVLTSSRQRVILGVTRFILNSGGRIFQPAILYLMEGLIKGLQARQGELPLQHSLSPSEVNEILRLSRLTGLPEISTNLQSIFCRQLCDLVASDWKVSNESGYNMLKTRLLELEKSVDDTNTPDTVWSISGELPSFQAFLKQLDVSKHRSIQGEAYAPASKSVVEMLDQANITSIDHDDLHSILNAFWEEAERREFSRSVAMHLPPLLFHPTCIQVCVSHYFRQEEEKDDSLIGLLSRAMEHLQSLSRGRTYILSVLVRSLRKVAFRCPSVLSVLPFEDFILDFLDNPPSVKPEFLFELAAAEKLQKLLPHRTYASYYGQREWHAYAALIDIIQRFPEEQLGVAKRILDRLLEPWRIQEAPIHIKSKWKETLQLQAMLLLSDLCIIESEASIYLESFMHALVLEPWPRFRFLLEWIVARILIRFPGNASRILIDLERLGDNSPIHIASLMKLGLLIVPFQTEDFAVKLATQLTYFCASPKVQIRHEANFDFPIVLDIAKEKGWTSVTGNPAFVALNTFLRQLDKFNASPWTIRTLKLEAVKDFTVVKIFQGQYLSIESPEKETVAYEDFLLLREEDQISGTNAPSEHMALGARINTDITLEAPAIRPNLPPATIGHSTPANPTFLQTKSGFDFNTLHPSSGSPSTQNQRPASVILVASLIDNPTNLGGLSRISESFGLEALYINDVKKIGHRDFKATSVTSEKHFPIGELKIPGVPDFLLEAKRKGYEVVGIEQTDRSGILGNGDIGGGRDINQKDLGTLPKKCVLVLGSEKGGISPEVLAVVDRCVEIKTVGVTRSLNVQTAGGIAVYEWWREWGCSN
ncbi:uncharacterized protein K460DRAFT_305932 [Cucurbitaria berberidis CBS 394.84]|uniref:tRNA/rRNA methyltransferase SpoU type domain-containing protein n=1 Tax=Cucurbitaria berberidis CBS 394.84 TaxID=1168544 RepID=A0A9P4L9J9_9PLEO|nr:uncharacterized protein K460DRAFT_305932 [Cucurbitaria berberidis CBS 394.84]KAF1847100.1 hypothetical protein K460DRAFT_305932 [Cucurbitaria berberidis CBS 394.84]